MFIRLGLSESSEITGLECRFHVYNEEENVDMKELFGMPKCKLDQLEEKYSKLKKNDERKFKMVLLLFIEFVLLGNDKKKFVSNLPLSLLKDMDAFNSYSWGRLVFNKTLDNLRDCEPTKYRASGNYCLSGFPLAFQVCFWFSIYVPLVWLYLLFLLWFTSLVCLLFIHFPLV